MEEIKVIRESSSNVFHKILILLMLEEVCVQYDVKKMPFKMFYIVTNSLTDSVCCQSKQHCSSITYIK